MPASIIVRPTSPQRLAAACPDGIDVYFENVGGAVQQTVWPLLNDFARVPVCGLIAQYNATAAVPGPDMISVASQAPDSCAASSCRISPPGTAISCATSANGCASGRLKYREDVVDGLENAPAAFLGLLQGRNFGKLLVRVASL